MKASEWRELLVELKVSRSAFYAMRNKLGAGMITNRAGVQTLGHIQPRSDGYGPVVVDGGSGQ